VTNGELASGVMMRMEPWIAFTEDALRKALTQTAFAGAPVEELAYAVVTYYLGLNLLTELDPRRARAEPLLTQLRTILS
jgi:hypothetical protein